MADDKMKSKRYIEMNIEELKEEMKGDRTFGIILLFISGVAYIFGTTQILFGSWIYGELSLFLGTFTFIGVLFVIIELRHLGLLLFMRKNH